MSVLKMLRAIRGLQIAEYLSCLRIVSMGLESQLARVGHTALHQLAEAGRIHRLQSLCLCPVVQASLILMSLYDRNKSILAPRQNTSNRNIARPMRPSGRERLKTRLPMPFSNRLAGTKHSRTVPLAASAICISIDQVQPV